MKLLENAFPRVLLSVALCTLVAGQAGCQRQSAVLSVDKSSQSQLEKLYPNTPAGERVKAHMHASMENGEGAEGRYQESLTKLRSEPGAAEALYETYRKVPPEDYMLRTMLTQGLKELRSPGALPYLSSIATEKIPAKLHPENTETDTRTDEVVIRITAVEGISMLADRSADAERILLEMTGHGDLTVRQMAARGYLNSPLGNVEEKMQALRRKLPPSEHWYITTKTTDIKQVPHPGMPAEFKLDSKNPSTPPTIKKP